MSITKTLETLEHRGVVTTDPARRDLCCGMPRDADGFCTHRSGHPIYVDPAVATEAEKDATITELRAEVQQWHDAAYNWAYFNQRRAEAAECERDELRAKYGHWQEARTLLCDADGIVRGGRWWHGTDYECTGSAHLTPDEVIRCANPIHDADTQEESR